MKWLTLLVLVAGRCQGYHEIEIHHQRLDAGNAPDGGDDAGPACRSWSLGASPRECAPTWEAAAVLFPACTEEDPGAGYRGRCGSWNVNIVEDRGARVVCYFDPGTGNLALSVESGTGASICKSYDPAFTSLPPGTCSALGPAACVDGGAL